MIKTAIKVLVVFVCMASLTSIVGCKEEYVELRINDTLTSLEDNVIFTNNSYQSTGGGTGASVTSNVSVLGDVTILDYGHCWITQNGTPTIENSKTNFGSTNSKSLTIISTIDNYKKNTRYYFRPYIRTKNGVIYGSTSYFN